MVMPTDVSVARATTDHAACSQEEAGRPQPMRSAQLRGFGPTRRFAAELPMRCVFCCIGRCRALRDGLRAVRARAGGFESRWRWGSMAQGPSSP